jgi:molybdopterin-guanine dinucleotide biosynthesis protein B
MRDHPPEAGATPRIPTPRILSVVGPQNAGKTTLVSRLCACWVARGLRVAVLKHDGHADERIANDWEKPGSDTVRYAEAGASFTMVAGGGQTLLRAAQDPHADDVAQLCRRLALYADGQGTPLDLILVEGYKRSDLPKLVPVHRASDVEWLMREPLSNLVAVVAAPAVYELAANKWPVYHEDDVERLCDDLWR